MPETAMHENDSLKANKSNIRLARNIFTMQTVAATAKLAA